MINKYLSIEDFLSCKTSCFFCDKPLGRRVTHFQSSFNELPIINAPIKNNIAVFPFRHTTASFDLHAKGRIDTRNNILTFTFKDAVAEGLEYTPNINNSLAMSVFSSMLPYAQLYCNCKYRYTATSSVFKMKQSEPDYIIEPLAFFYESFVLSNWWIQNNYWNNKTNIHARNKESAPPITCPILNWEEMGREKLLTRIKTLVVFS